MFQRLAYPQYASVKLSDNSAVDADVVFLNAPNSLIPQYLNASPGYDRKDTVASREAAAEAVVSDVDVTRSEK